MKKSLKTPKLWQRKRGGKSFGSFHVEIGGKRVNLATKDASEAIRRRKEAMKGKRDFEDDSEGVADDIIAAFEEAPDAKTAGVVEGAPPEPDAARFPAEAPTVPPPSPNLLPPIVPDGYSPPAAAGWADDASAAAGASATAGADDAPPPIEVSDDELARLAVEAQIWCAEKYAQAKVYKKFRAPGLPDEAKAALVNPWQKLIAYAGVGAILPPWVTGLVIPAFTIVFATTSLAAAMAELAAEQKKAGGASEPATTTGEPVAAVA